MTREDVAIALEEVGVLLELQGESTFRTLAYKNAARALLSMSDDLQAAVESGKLGEVQGIGDSMREKIETLSRAIYDALFRPILESNTRMVSRPSRRAPRKSPRMPARAGIRP